MTDPMTPPAGPDANVANTPTETPAPVEEQAAPAPSMDPRDAEIAALHAQLEELQAASTRTAPTDAVSDDPNDTAGTTKTPPAVGDVVDHVYFDHYDATVPGGQLVHQQVAVVSIEHDDDDHVIGARVLPVTELPLIPLAHLRY